MTVTIAAITAAASTIIVTTKQPQQDRLA